MARSASVPAQVVDSTLFHWIRVGGAGGGLPRNMAVGLGIGNGNDLSGFDRNEGKVALGRSPLECTQFSGVLLAAVVLLTLAHVVATELEEPVDALGDLARGCGDGLRGSDPRGGRRRRGGCLFG